MTSPVSAIEAIEKARLAIRIGGSMTAYAYTETDDGGDYITVEDAKSIITDIARQAEALQRRAEAAEALAERLKREAQAHAMEARTANSTIYEIYQIVSGGKGEPGNWHGAAPVREKLEALEREADAMRARAIANARERNAAEQLVDELINLRCVWTDPHNDELCRRARALLKGGSDAE